MVMRSIGDVDEIRNATFNQERCYRDLLEKYATC